MKTFVFVSSWCHGKEEGGIGVYELNLESGELTFVEKAEKETAFNVTVIDRERHLIYASNETMALPGMRNCGGGQIFVFSYDPESGHLTKLASKPTWCPNPSYIGIDHEKKYAVVSNHGGMSAVSKIEQDMYGAYVPRIEFDDVNVELFALNEDGTLGDLLDVVKHGVNSLNPECKVAHPHTAVFSPDGSLVAVCDKGNDTVRMYKIDREKGKLYLDAAPLQHKADAKPRYCVFHPEGKYFYHNCEKDMNFYAYAYDEDGGLTLINKVNTLPEGFVPKPGPGTEQQGLSISADGRFIYDIVRGPNNISVFKVSEVDGSVELVQAVPVDDGWPRGCALSPDGKFFIVCGLKGGKAFVYKVADDGLLSETGYEISQEAAAYVNIL